MADTGLEQALTRAVRLRQQYSSFSNTHILFKVRISIYYPKIENYIIPGPRPFTCNGSGSSTGGTTPTSTPTSSSPTSTTTTTSTGTGGTVAKYGQCGGSSYSGPTQCEAGSTCTVVNPYVRAALTFQEAGKR